MNVGNGCNYCDHDIGVIKSPSHPFDKNGCNGYGHIDHNKPYPPPLYKPPYYPCDCPPPGRFPSAGSMMGNAFILNDCFPYIYDNSLVQYGTYMKYSENILTRITQRSDRSCINLTATFDMIDNTNTNAMWCHFLEQTIINNYEHLGGILPIVKSGIIFKLYYDITDMYGCVVHESSVKVISNDMKIHFTDIRDKIVTSCKDIIITNIPRMDYRGMYTITLNRIEAYVETIDTISHIKNGMNQFYQFIDNNLKIAIQHNVIDKQEPDNIIMIASCDICKSFQFQANVTTRLRLSFVAFMSNLITPPNTYGIWSALNDSRNAIIRDLSHEIYILKEEMSNIKTEYSILKDELNEMNNHISDSSDIIDQCRIDVDNMKDDVTELTTMVENLSEKISSGDSELETYSKQEIDRFLFKKVDKVDGKVLSSNDYTDQDKNLLHNITSQVNFNTILEFPTIGESNKLYVATDKYLTYIWDDISKSYVNLDKNNIDVDTIQSIIGEINANTP